MHRGYVKIYRKLADWYLWEKKPFDKARAWIDLILLANHKPGVIDVRGIMVPVARGQVGWSKKRLANKWGWSEGMVTRFFLQLQNDAQIVVQKSNVTSLITIKNYDKYHGDEAQNGDQTERRQRADGAQTETNNNDKELEEGEEVTATGLPEKIEEDKMLISMPELAVLRTVPGYPFDLKTDFAKLSELSLEFPQVDVVPMLKNWVLYITDHKFTKKSSPRGQLYNQFKSASTKGMYKKASDNGGGPRQPDALQRMQEKMGKQEQEVQD